MLEWERKERTNRCNQRKPSQAIAIGSPSWRAALVDKVRVKDGDEQHGLDKDSYGAHEGDTGKKAHEISLVPCRELELEVERVNEEEPEGEIGNERGECDGRNAEVRHQKVEDDAPHREGILAEKGDEAATRPVIIRPHWLVVELYP